MKKLTKKEEEIMRHFWAKGYLFVRELIDLYPEPRPHFNTLSTMVRSLESKGYLSHKAYGNSHQYFPLITAEEFGQSTLSGVIGKYFGSSYLKAVSALVEEEKISIEELQSLIEQVKKS